MAIVGGTDIRLRLELVQLLSRDFDVCVFGPDRSAVHLFRQVGADYRFYPMTRGVRPWRDLMTVVALARHFRSIHPDIVHTYDTKPCALGRLAAWMARVPVIIGTLPGMGSLYASNGRRIILIRWVYERIQKLACKISDLNILQNAEDLEDFVSRGIMARSKTKIVHGSGVNTQTFRPGKLSGDEASGLRTSIGVGAETFVVAMVSRIMRTKGVLEYATAARQISGRRTDVQFLLIGSDDRDSPDRLTPKELEILSGSVRCLGRRTDVVNILSITDVFVFPSFSMEGVPRALLEAAACGLPIVTTKTRGCSDVVDDGISGILVSPRDPKALVAATLSLLDDPGRRVSLGRAARSRAVREFDVTLIAGQIARLYLDFSRMGSSRQGKIENTR